VVDTVLFQLLGRGLVDLRRFPHGLDILLLRVVVRGSLLGRWLVLVRREQVVIISDFSSLTVVCHGFL